MIDQVLIISLLAGLAECGQLDEFTETSKTICLLLGGTPVLTGNLRLVSCNDLPDSKQACTAKHGTFRRNCYQIIAKAETCRPTCVVDKPDVQLTPVLKHLITRLTRRELAEKVKIPNLTKQYKLKSRGQSLVNDAR